MERAGNQPIRVSQFYDKAPARNSVTILNAVASYQRRVMQRSQPVPLANLLDAESDSLLAESLVGVSLDQAIEFATELHRWPEAKRRRSLARLFECVPRAQRGTMLIALLRSDYRENIEYACDQVYRVEVPQLHQHLVANGLESTADEAIDFAVTQMLDYAPSIDHLRGWLRTIAVRKAVQLKKKLYNSMEAGMDEEVSISSWLISKETDARSYASEMVVSCRETAISATENQILEYYFFQERSGTEIANQVNVSKSSVYLQIKSAVEKLRRCLEAKLG